MRKQVGQVAVARIDMGTRRKKNQDFETESLELGLCYFIIFSTQPGIDALYILHSYDRVLKDEPPLSIFLCLQYGFASLIPATGFTHDKENLDKRQGETSSFFEGFSGLTSILNCNFC